MYDARFITTTKPGVCLVSQCFFERGKPQILRRARCLFGSSHQASISEVFCHVTKSSCRCQFSMMAGSSPTCVTA
jgi:hypothetical protein